MNHLIHHHLVHLVYLHHLSVLASYEKAKKTKDREPFYKKRDGVVYLPGDINGLMEILHLLAAEFFAGNTSVRNELVRLD